MIYNKLIQFIIICILNRCYNVVKQKYNSSFYLIPYPFSHIPFYAIIYTKQIKYYAKQNPLTGTFCWHYDGNHGDNCFLYSYSQAFIYE